MNKLLLAACAVLPACALDSTSPTAPSTSRFEARNSTVLAETRLGDTAVAFTQNDDDGSVDVALIGRHGAPDVGALVAERQLTPLQLFTRLEPEATPPDALVRDHAERAARGGEPPVASASPDGETTVGLSTFTCLSWDNFNEHLGKLWTSSSPRWQDSDSSSSFHQRIAPALNGLFPGGAEVDLYVCNFNSDGNADDTVVGEICDDNFLQAGHVEHCTNALLHDGEYLRRIYTNPPLQRRYRISGQPISQNALTTYLGWVGKD